MRLRCLIVDDNARFLESSRASLERQGVEVVAVASTAEETVRHAAALRPDVALIDVGLGEESGFELAQRLVAVLPDQRMRIVLISTRGEDEYADMVATSPAVGFLSKSHLSAVALRELLVRGDGRPGPGDVETGAA
jgi:two-component system, NarL family, nitrate/nitrite response regulator NarL